MTIYLFLWATSWAAAFTEAPKDHQYVSRLRVEFVVRSSAGSLLRKQLDGSRYDFVLVNSYWLDAVQR